MAFIGTLGAGYFGYPVPDVSVIVADARFVYPHPWPGGRQVQNLNKAWDPAAAGGSGDWVFWSTLDPDTSGFSYPGPSAFAATSDYRVQDLNLVDIDNP